MKPSRVPGSSVLGDARWMSMRDAKALFPATGKVVIGEAYQPWTERRGTEDMVPGNPRTWGSGGTASGAALRLLLGQHAHAGVRRLRRLQDDQHRHSDRALRTPVRWSFSIPRLEIGQQVAPLRQRLKGPSGKPRQVFTIDPLASAVKGCDVLDLLRRHPRQDLAIGAYVKMLLTEKPKAQSGSDAFFEGNNTGLMSGLLMYVLHGRVTDYERTDTRRPTLRQLRTLTALPEKDLKAYIGLIYANEGVEQRPGFVRNEAARRYIRQTLAPFVSMAQESWTGISAQINTDTKWLSVTSLADTVCNPDFALADLPKGETDVFLQFDAEVLKSNVGVVRILLGAMFQAMQTQERAKGAESVLFCLDEVDALGYMSALEEARDRGRKFGISLMMLYQSVGQIEKHFGKDGAVAWFDSAAIVSYAVVTSPETADRISKQAGECTVEVQGTSERSNWWFGLWAKGAQSQSRMTYSTNLQKRPLILPHEVREMRRDEQIIFVAAKPALRCGRAIFFRRPEMLEGLGKSKLREGAAAKPTARPCPWTRPTTPPFHPPSTSSQPLRPMRSPMMALRQRASKARDFESNIAAETPQTLNMTRPGDNAVADAADQSDADQPQMQTAHSTSRRPATPPIASDPFDNIETQFVQRPSRRARS